MASEEAPDRHDIEALLATRQELGSSYDAALVESFTERVERAIATRSGQGAEVDSRAWKYRTQVARQQMTIGIVSLGCGIPISAIATALGHLPGLGIAWAGIVGVNVAHALQGRRNP